MMNKRIRSMIDEIFANMKMSAENLALRDELMANAQARYEDSISSGKSEEEAFAEVAASLGDVYALLEEINGEKPVAPAASEAPAAPEAPEASAAPETPETPEVPETPETPEAPEAPEEPAAEQAGKADFDLGDTLNGVFSALGDLGKSVVPQAKKFVRDVDKATGGVILDVGRAVNKGMRDAQKAAGDAIDKLSGKSGEIVIDFGKPEKKKSAKDLRDEADDLRAQAALKEAAGDPEGAQQMREQADSLEAQALACEQEEMMEAARQAAAQQTAQDAADAARAEEDEAIDGEEDAGDDEDIEEDVEEDVEEDIEENIDGDADEEADADEDGEPAEEEETVYTVDGEVDEDAFTRAVNGMVRDAERMARDAQDFASKVTRNVTDALNPEKDEDEDGGDDHIVMRFPVAGLRKVDVKLNADDVVVEPIDGHDIEVEWETNDSDNKPDVRLEDHTLLIRRTTPDAFKTFFSVFKKDGGEVTVRVPRGYAADYELSTTSGDVRLRDVDVDDVKLSTVSGDVRFEPEASVRAKTVEVQTVSGDATVSACAEQVKVSTVSGDQFVSCDTGRVEASVVSGDAHVEGACDEWEIGSVSGDAELICTVVPARKIHISTMSGSAKLSLPGDIRGFAADISSVSGRVNNEFGPNRYGTCALPIHMDTMSGNLIITRL